MTDNGRFENRWLDRGLMGLIYAAGIATLLVHGFHHGSAAQTSCPSVLATITLDITAAGFNPQHITTHRCSKLVIRNTSPSPHQVAFGEHDHHIAYAGTMEKLLAPGRSLELVLSQAGELRIHDHLNNDLAAELTVTP